MGFFEEIKGIIGDMNITISITASGERLTVISLPKPKDKDEPLKGFVPLCITGTAEQLDAGFINSLAKSVDVLNGLQSNLNDVEQSTLEAEEKPKGVKTTRKTRSKKEEVKKEVKEEVPAEEPSGDDDLPFSDTKESKAEEVFDDIKPEKQEEAKPVGHTAKPIAMTIPKPAQPQPTVITDNIGNIAASNSQPINEAEDEW
jgi:PRTRC genetic system protein E